MSSPRYRYVFLHPQSINVRFVFNALVLVDCLHGVPECSGSVQAWISVSGKVSGPFDTGIMTQTSVWEGRHYARIPPESEELLTELRACLERIESVWEKLVKAGHTVTGELIYEHLSHQQAAI